MSERKQISNSKFGERYYHVLGIEPVSGLYSSQSFWRDCPEVSRRGIEVIDAELFSVEIGDFQSNFRYHSGEDSYSNEGNDNPPFYYKVIVITNKLNNQIFLAFPFRAMAKNIITKLIEKKNLKQKCNFLTIDLDKLLRIGSEKSLLVNDFFSVNFASIELSLNGETRIKAIKIDGERPLDSELYKDVFLQKVMDRTCGLLKCILKCLVIEDHLGIPRTRSHIHMDKFGNNRFYIHATGNNIFTVPILFEMLKKMKCLKSSNINPLNLNDL